MRGAILASTGRMSEVPSIPTTVDAPGATRLAEAGTYPELHARQYWLIVHMNQLFLASVAPQTAFLGYAYGAGMLPPAWFALVTWGSILVVLVLCGSASSRVSCQVNRGCVAVHGYEGMAWSPGPVVFPLSEIEHVSVGERGVHICTSRGVFAFHGMALEPGQKQALLGQIRLERAKIGMEQS